MPRVLEGSYGGGRCLMSEVPLYAPPQKPFLTSTQHPLQLPRKWGAPREREFFTDNPLVQARSIIEMTRWTGLTPCEFEFP
jgi:hypothetical protein